MARNNSFFDDIKKELECSVCQEQFSQVNEPKILKCLHTFCKTCLEAWSRRQHNGELSCPTCRHITHCPNNDISKLPSNLFCKQLVEIVEAYGGQGQEDSLQCGHCDEGRHLKFYCSNCNFLLCGDCSVVHEKIKPFRGHEIKEIGNFGSGDLQDYSRRANFCKYHQDQIRFFCVKCRICICRDCAILEHQDHKKISLEQGIENNESEIEDKMREVQANRSWLTTFRETLQGRRLKQGNDIEEATKEVKRVAEHSILLIRQHEARVIEKLLRHHETWEGAFSAQMNILDGKVMEIDNTLVFCEEVLQRKNLPEILNVKTMIEERLQELSLTMDLENLPKLDFSRVKYVPSDFDFPTYAPGKLLISNTEPSKSVAEGRGLTEGRVGDLCTFTIIAKDSSGKTTYSEIDEVKVAIKLKSRHQNENLESVNSLDGRYSVSYKPTTNGEYAVSININGVAIKGSPFILTVKEKLKDGGGDLDHMPLGSRDITWHQVSHRPEKTEALDPGQGDPFNADSVEDITWHHVSHQPGKTEALDPGQGDPFNADSVDILPFEVLNDIIKPSVEAQEKELDEIGTEFMGDVSGRAEKKKIALGAMDSCSVEDYADKPSVSILTEKEDQQQWEMHGEEDDRENALTFSRKEKVEIVRKSTGKLKSEKRRAKHWSKVNTSEKNEFGSLPENHNLLGATAVAYSHPLSASSKTSASRDSYTNILKKCLAGNDASSLETREAVVSVGNRGNTDEECPICLTAISNPRSLNCKHIFCSVCIETALNMCNKCPVCQKPQGVPKGNQPPGVMTSRVSGQSLPGYEGYGTIMIEYSFASGIQDREHPNPGQYYNGTNRQAYLPDTREGQEVLQLLKRAFDARLVFTVGTSTTSGLKNQITWNDIHHKTSIHGGPYGFGYPDPDYLRRVKEELADKGIH